MSDLYALSPKQQANVRIGICLFMGAYFYPTGFFEHPLYISFIAYSVAIFGITRRVNSLRFRSQFIFITLLFDVTFTIVSLHLVGPYGYFLFLILIQICFGYGVRYGTLLLWTSTLFACFGILTLFLTSDFWRGRPFEVISFLAGVPFLAIYIHFLNGQLIFAKKQSDIQASTYSKLLQFVSHDIRVQLQALLGASDEMLAERPNPSTVKHIFRAREIIYALARLATNFIQEVPDKVDYNYRKDSGPNNELYVLGDWIGKVCSRFSPQIRANGTRLTVLFLEDVPINIRLNFPSLERLFVNSLSNAVRHSKNGLIEIEIGLESRENDQNFIAVRVKNVCPGGFSKNTSNDDAALSQRLFFGSGLGHVISNEIALEAGGSFSTKAIGPEAFICTIEMPCFFLSTFLPKPMAYPVVFFTSTVEKYQRAKELLSSTCGLYRCPITLYPSIRMHQNFDNISSFIFDASVDNALPDENFNGGTGKYERTRCDVLLEDNVNGTSLAYLSNCVALGTLSPYSLNSAIAFAAAYNQKGAKLERIFCSASLDYPKLSGIYIEDSNFNASFILAAVRREGWDVDHANLVTQALEMLRDKEYDFVLVDWEIGNDTALDFLDAYQRFQFKSTNICIVILSAHERARIYDLIGQRKVHLILEKPISADALIEHIASNFRFNNNFLNLVRERLTLVPQELFDCENYEPFSVDSAQRNIAIYLLDTLIVEIDAALEDLSRCQDCITSEFRRLAHRLIGVAAAGGANAMANSARALLAELNDSHDCSKHDLNQVNAVWIATVRHIRTFQATLS